MPIPIPSKPGGGRPYIFFIYLMWWWPSLSLERWRRPPYLFERWSGHPCILYIKLRLWCTSITLYNVAIHIYIFIYVNLRW